MNELTSIVLFLLIVINVITHGVILCKAIDRNDGLWIIPSRLYQTTKMNKFGCICTSILLFLVAPINAIGVLLYWFAHVGRK